MDAICAMAWRFSRVAGTELRDRPRILPGRMASLAHLFANSQAPVLVCVCVWEGGGVGGQTATVAAGGDSPGTRDVLLRGAHRAVFRTD